MKKKLLAGLATGVVLFGMAGVAGAVPYSFDDLIDYRDGANLGEMINDGEPLTYVHDVTDSVNFGAGDIITNATLELRFVDDEADDVYSTASFWGVTLGFDHREYAKYSYDGKADVSLGEIDGLSYFINLDVDTLNDGLLNMTVSVHNDLGSAGVMLSYSKLSGTADTAPVPEPATMLLFGTGLAGLAGVNVRRRKSIS